MSPQPRVVNKLVGKKVVVIGGTSGIGFAVASALIEEGATVIVSSSSAAKVDQAVARLNDASIQYNADPSRVSGDALDLAGPEAEAAIATFFAKIGTLDHVVFTAGSFTPAVPLAETTAANIIEEASVRFIGALLVAKAAARHLPPGGSLILTTGAVSERPVPGWAARGGLAAGALGLTRQLAYDLSPQRIRVNCVAPGMIRSEFWDHLPAAARDGLYAAAAANSLTQHAPEAHEIAESYLYLLKDTNMWVRVTADVYDLSAHFIHSTGETISTSSGSKYGPPPSQAS
jgi:NAD(P)-dependent dehydrogenase (short-subunit alcohol dehydrogenase family)